MNTVNLSNVLYNQILHCLGQINMIKIKESKSKIKNTYCTCYIV
jgi:hypothetical protein